jgi:hypothetical protein
MQLKNTRAFLEALGEMEMPITNTTRGEQIQQTFRNNLTAQLKETLFEDCSESFPADDPSGIMAYRVKEGVILEIPNSSVADGITNEYGSGAISIEFKFTIKGLDYNAAEMADDYAVLQKAKAATAKENERKRQEKIEKDAKSRAAREAKRAKMLEIAARFASEQED